MVNNTAKFNMSMATLERIDEVLRMAGRAYRRGDLRNYFLSLKGAKLQAQFKFKEEGMRDKLTKLEVAYHNEKDKQKKWAAAEKYHELLLDNMETYSMLIPDKMDDTDTAY